MAAQDGSHVHVLIEDAHAADAKQLHEDFMQEEIAQVRDPTGIGQQKRNMAASAVAAVAARRSSSTEMARTSGDRGMQELD